MDWKMRYAPHLGLPGLRTGDVPTDLPLFRFGAASVDPIDQIAYLSRLGFAGVQDNFLMTRPVEVQAAMGEALNRRGMEMGCFLAGVEHLARPVWGSRDPDAVALTETLTTAAIEAAARAGGRIVTIVTAADPTIPPPIQHAIMADNLRRAAAQAEAAGIVLGVEAVSARAFPAMLVHHIADAFQIVRAVASPAVKLVFDIYQVQAMDGDIIAGLDRCWDEIAIIQVADNPGRCELGSGELNWSNIFRYLVGRSYDGLIELEHRLSHDAAAGETAALEALRAIDQAI